MNQGYRLVRLHFSTLILFLFNKLYFLVRQLWLIFFAFVDFRFIRVLLHFLRTFSVRLHFLTANISFFLLLRLGD